MLGIYADWACENGRKGGEVVNLFHGDGRLYDLGKESKSSFQTNLGSWPKSEKKVVLPKKQRTSSYWEKRRRKQRYLNTFHEVA